MADLWVYSKEIVSKKATSAVSLVALALAIWNGFRSPNKPVVLPLWVWLVVLTVSLMAAQFLVWRDVHISPVDDDHAQHLRTIAGQLKDRIEAGQDPIYHDGCSDAPIIKDLFAAHFPSEVARVDALARERVAVKEAEAALESAIEREAREKFPTSQRWSPNALIERCSLELPQLVNTHGLEDIDYLDDQHGNALAWKDRRIRISPEADDKARVAAWIAEIFNSPASNDYRAARTADGDAHVLAVAALDPIIHHGRITRAKSCVVCFPPRHNRARTAGAT